MSHYSILKRILNLSGLVLDPVMYIFINPEVRSTGAQIVRDIFCRCFCCHGCCLSCTYHCVVHHAKKEQVELIEMKNENDELDAETVDQMESETMDHFRGKVSDTTIFKYINRSFLCDKLNMNNRGYSLWIDRDFQWMS